MPLTNSIHTPVEELIHGVVVRDPYRWLEDRNLPETEEWLRNQRLRCEEYFADCSNLDGLRKRVREYLDIEVVDQPARVAGRYFYRRRDRGQEQASIYVRDMTSGLERLLVDPAAMGPFTSVGIHHVSEDGSLLAYELKRCGGDRKAIHIVDVVSGRMLSDSIETGYARGFSFSSDLRGFYYCHEVLESPEDHSICVHLFGEPTEDQACFRAPRTRGSRLLLRADEIHLGALYVHELDGEFVVDFWIARRNETKIWNCVFANRTLPFGPILKQGRLFAIRYEGAPGGKLVELDLAGTEIRTVVAEQAGIIRELIMLGDKIFINYLDQLEHSVHCWNLAGKDMGRIPIPPNGTVQLLAHHGDDGNSVFYTFESFTQPPILFEYGIGADEPRLLHRRCVPIAPLCTLREANYPSGEGLSIPITLVTPNGVGLRDGSPVLMTTYGGFGVSMTPQFSALVSIIMELGCTFVLPHIRGGGEFGKDWHEAGRGRNRQVAFSDFIAAAEWLNREGLTSHRLAIFGGSNSGLLVCAAMTQRPDLFTAVLCIAPLLDMVRYESFDQASKWRKEYGTVNDPQDFGALYAYSPYHHIGGDIDYPSVLFVAGDSDVRCNPAHVRKMAARLQNRAAQRSPVVVDYCGERGHSPVLPLSVRIEALARRIAFLCKELNLPVVCGDRHETACA
jgi:prolyl oligopeptidase